MATDWEPKDFPIYALAQEVRMIATALNQQNVALRGIENQLAKLCFILQTEGVMTKR